MRRSAALLTVVEDSEARGRWEQSCRQSWQEYADRYGYDLLCLPASPETRGARGWRQRALALQDSVVQRYERVLSLDPAVVIHPASPDVVASTPVDRVGAVDAYGTPSRARHRAALRRLYRYWEDRGVAFVKRATPEAFYESQGFPGGLSRVVQAGVLVLSPVRHLEVMRRVCAAAPTDDDGAALSHALLSADLVHWLDPLFNVSWLVQKCEEFPFLFSRPRHPRAGDCARRALSRSWFLNFEGCESEQSLIEDGRVGSDTPCPEPQHEAARDSGEAPFRLETPVALFLYNRAETVREVFATIRRARPQRLLLIADGPRPDDPADAAACAAARDAVSAVDWPCDVLTHFSRENMGIRRRIDSGLEWVFANCDEAILLEDDCVPDATFFRYCQELLGRYREDSRVMGVGGNSFQYGLGASDDGYYFSNYAQTWGWATWRRAWRLYDPGMSRWPELRDQGWLGERAAGPQAASYWSHVFDQNYQTRAHWDLAWMFSTWVQGGCFALPRRMLVSNLGLGREATHTRQYDIEFADLPTCPMRFPLRHPDRVTADSVADGLTDDLMFGGMVSEIFARIRRVTPR